VTNSLNRDRMSVKLECTNTDKFLMSTLTAHTSPLNSDTVSPRSLTTCFSCSVSECKSRVRRDKLSSRNCCFITRPHFLRRVSARTMSPATGTTAVLRATCTYLISPALTHSSQYIIKVAMAASMRGLREPP